MIVHNQTDEHNQAVNYSISQIGFFINTVSMILNFELLFPLCYNYTHFIVSDLFGTKLALNITEPYEFENALIYLYENFRSLQQHSGVDFSRTKGIFDIKSLEESPFIGRFFDIPSVPISKEIKINEITGTNSDDDEWELIDDDE